MIANHAVTLGGDGYERRRLESVLRQATTLDPAGRYPSVPALMCDLIPALRALPDVDGASPTTLP